MKQKNYLLSYRFRKIGWIVMAATLAFYAMTLLFPNLSLSFDVLCFAPGKELTTTFALREMVLNDTIEIVGLLVALLFIALSEEKFEDECTASIRAKAFTIATWVSYLALILVTFLVFDLSYLNILIINLFAFPIVFIITRQVLMYNFMKQNSNEESN